MLRVTRLPRACTSHYTRRLRASGYQGRERRLCPPPLRAHEYYSMAVSPLPPLRAYEYCIKTVPPPHPTPPHHHHLSPASRRARILLNDNNPPPRILHIDSAPLHRHGSPPLSARVRIPFQNLTSLNLLLLLLTSKSRLCKVASTFFSR